MNKFQKAVLINFIAVIAITSAAVIAMINLRDYVNRSEAMRAMTQLGERVLQYRKDHGAIPPQAYIDRVRESLEGSVRLGTVHYRAQWIDFESPDDEILAYAKKDYDSLLVHSGCIVLRLSGEVEWMDTQTFEALLHKQLKPGETHNHD